MKSIRYLAKKSDFIEFFDRSIKNNKSNIKKWIEKNFLDINQKTDTETSKAFFEAEKALATLYLKEDKDTELTSLIEAFHSIGNDTINKIELSILGNILQEEKIFIISHKPAQETLRSIFKSFAGAAHSYLDDDPNIQRVWSWGEEILGNLSEENSLNSALEDMK